MMLAYCDYIADRIHKALRLDRLESNTLLSYVDKIAWDLDPEGGWMVSTKKTIQVEDINQKRYRITIEEIS